jgi:hypothetical protein
MEGELQRVVGEVLVQEVDNGVRVEVDRVGRVGGWQPAKGCGVDVDEGLERRLALVAVTLVQEVDCLRY